MRWRSAIYVLMIVTRVAVGAATTAPATTQAASLPEPTRVTLHLDRAPAADALAALFKQADVSDHGLLHPSFREHMAGVNVTVNVTDQPYLDALLEICRQAHLEPVDNRAPGRPMYLQIHPPATTEPSWLDAPRVTAGPFVFVVRKASRSSHVDLESKTTTRAIKLDMIALRDPKIRLFEMASALEIDTAQDEHGRSLAPPDEHASPIKAELVQDRGQFVWGVSATLDYPKEPTHTLALLRGRLHTSLVTRSERVELMNGKGVMSGARDAGGVHFNVKGFDSTGEASRIAISVNPVEGEGDEWTRFRGLVQASDFRVTDGAGSSYFVNVQMSPVQASGAHEGMIEFRGFRALQADPKPAQVPTSVIWNVPTEITDVDIPVEIHDLPLP